MWTSKVTYSLAQQYSATAITHSTSPHIYTPTPNTSLQSTHFTPSFKHFTPTNSHLPSHFTYFTNSTHFTSSTYFTSYQFTPRSLFVLLYSSHSQLKAPNAPFIIVPAKEYTRSFSFGCCTVHCFLSLTTDNKMDYVTL